MASTTSKLEAGRQHGDHQVPAQRESILDAAEALFLKNGLEHTRMIDIAAQAGITKISLYRYFPNRDVIAVEIHRRMLARIAALALPDGLTVSLSTARTLARQMIRSFDSLRDAYRYMGMFDHRYLDNPPDAALPQWTKDLLLTFDWDGASLEDLLQDSAEGSRFIMVLSTVIWFLEKLALRGEMTWSSQAVPLETHLQLFEEMILGYIDQNLGSAG
jgi:AcrR family transcriptional regulator